MMQEQTPARPKKRKWWSKDARAEITGPELEAAIAEEVRKTASCEDFVGVFVVRKTPKSNADPNWEVQGARFGKADRQLADKTLAEVVQRMQQEVLLTEDRKEAAPRPTGGQTVPLDNVRPQFEGSHKTAAKG